MLLNVARSRNQFPGVSAVGGAEDAGAVVGIECVIGIAGTLSVSGLKTMEEVFAVPALFADQTPPPVVPMKSRLPVASDGSSASEETRPETRPKLGVTTAAGPRACQVAVAGEVVEPAGWAETRAVGD